MLNIVIAFGALAGIALLHLAYRLGIVPDFNIMGS